ncbi:MAG: HlyC/CorC family transporter [Planctomycetaceae bacterium]|nr:HlyC/CorC family transporter [Planctomycetaceae bacterium]
MWTIELIVIVGMIAVNSVFAGYEIALASVSPGKLQALAREKRRGAAAALRMKESMEASLAVVQLGITLVGAVAAATGGAGAEEWLEPVLRGWGLSTGVSQTLAIALVVLPLTVFTIIFGELVPKVFAMRNREWVCLKLSPPMEWFSRSVSPAVWFLEGSVTWIMKWAIQRWNSHSEEDSDESVIQELQGVAALARMSRLIGRREEGIIVSASRLAATPLSKVMLPAEYIGMLVTDQTLNEALIAAHQEMHTRFPVTEEAGNPQRIIGYVNFKDIVVALRLAPRDPSLRNLVRRLLRFSAGMSVATCLEHLIRERNHIALVTDSSGIIIGMITLEDIVEELVGEIHDELDRMPVHLTPAGQGWIAGGFVPLTQLRQTTGIELRPLSEKPVYTLNDWIVEHLDRPPRGGDELEEDDWRIAVRKVRHVLVQEAFLSRKNGPVAQLQAPSEEASPGAAPPS